MNTLFELTLRGSAASVIILVLDRLLAGRLSGPSRRVWWCFLPLAFLIPVHIPVPTALDRLQPATEIRNLPQRVIPQGKAASPRSETGWISIEVSLWLAGALSYVALVGIQTARVSRKWTRERLSTDHSLLELLEKCKAEAGVTAPIGIVVSSSVVSPAILGWLRPRILLPESIAAALPGDRLRPILLHELAHFRWYDVPFNWLLTLIRSVHWFNPMAHIGSISWARFREEAADEAAVAWMRDSSAGSYGDALVYSLRECHGSSVPFGSLAIVESVRHLKRRLFMINRLKDKAPRVLFTGVVSLLLAVVVCSIKAQAPDDLYPDPKAAVIAISRTWLEHIDGEDYQLAYNGTGAWFHYLVSAEEWIPWMKKSVREHGKCTKRAVAKDVTFETDPKGSRYEGDWANVVFRSSFEKGSDKSQLVSLKKEKDGFWKVAGYSIEDWKEPSVPSK
jgi:beta-lactamase regulating signal transducer with metallopeptidase domain